VHHGLRGWNARRIAAGSAHEFERQGCSPHGLGSGETVSGSPRVVFDLGVLVWFTLGEGKVLVAGKPVGLRLLPLLIIGGLALRTVWPPCGEDSRRRERGRKFRAQGLARGLM